ncbi:hypothetical protein Nepgr_007333 [Nepenthes gracilis]|uniref:Cyclic nucleotide-binding domain-containing protein n=1 Tax=Nepenthes gracilis TaxID=150966 RepID=A0AAD3S6N1_NEPGR|nr:hypothetical protein Nepgr_007333 [Nepenthes gracilis]
MLLRIVVQLVAATNFYCNTFDADENAVRGTRRTRNNFNYYVSNRRLFTFKYVLFSKCWDGQELEVDEERRSGWELQGANLQVDLCCVAFYVVEADVRSSHEACVEYQIVIWFIIPATKNPQADHNNNALALIDLLQYVPRLFQIFPLNSQIVQATGVITKTAWAWAAYNPLLYMLTGHVLRVVWRLLEDLKLDLSGVLFNLRWLATRGVDEEAILRGLPSDLRRDIQRHLCLDLVRKVPLFSQMDGQLLDAICDRRVSPLSTQGTYIVCEGDFVTEMLFIFSGWLQSTTTNGGRTGFFNSITLRPGAFAFSQGDEWANPFWKLVHDGLNTPGKKQVLAANGIQMCRLHCPVQFRTACGLQRACGSHNKEW